MADTEEEIVFATNPQYAFRISRNRSNVHWLSNEVARYRELLGQNTILGQVIPQLLFWIEYPFDISLRSDSDETIGLLSLLDQPSFRIVDAIMTEDDSTKLIKYTFEYDWVPFYDGIRKTHYGVFRVDPLKEWIIVDFEWTQDKSQPKSSNVKGRFSDFVRYRGVLLPKRQQVLMNTLLGDDIKTRELDRVIEYDEVFDTTQCFLSHYDLPEPDWYRPPPPYWLYASIIGMILLVIGALLLRYGKRLWRKGSTK